MKQAIKAVFGRLGLFSLDDQNAINAQEANDSDLQIELEEYIAQRTQCIEEMIRESSKAGSEGAVYIFQCMFFDTTGETYYSGGAERYIADLSRIIVEYNYQPFLIQMGDQDASDPWVREFNGLTVVGVNGSNVDYFQIIEKLDDPILAIYSGLMDWNGCLHTPNIVISHGVTWDTPSVDVNVDSMKKIIDSLESLVSVDTNTISWFRATFSNSLTANPVRMIYIPNYVDRSQFCPSNPTSEKDGIRISFPRRSCPERGFWLVSSVIPRLLDKYKNVDFEFVGFVHFEDIASRIEELKESYPGRILQCVVEASDMPDVYHRADIVLIPTTCCEGTSLSCIEAMACGKAIVATNVGGLSNLIIGGFNGLLISPDESELFEAIDCLIADQGLRNQLASNALEVSAAFSKEAWMQRWRRVLEPYLVFEEINDSDGVLAIELEQTAHQL